MGVVPGLLASFLLTAAGPPRPDVPPIGYQVKLLEMNGLGWREALYARLRPVKRQVNATVWTADRELAAELAKCAGDVLTAPRVTADNGHRAFVMFHGQT